MAIPRNSIPDFEVANAAYALSEVTVFIANPDGSKGALATLYSSLAGLGTLPNPQTLDNTGKWQQPVYIDSDSILQINSPLDPLLDHDTGIVRFGGRWRGVWTGPGTRYNIDDLILGPVGQPEESNVYRSQQIWNSTGTWATDVADATKLVLELDYQTLRTLAMAAVPDASETVKGKIELATQAETNAGADDLRAVTPLKLFSMAATETQRGVAEVATQTETNTGANDTTIVTPAKLHARVASETLQGLIAIATQAEVSGASNDSEAVTPAKLWATPMRGGDRNVLGANGNFNIWQRGAGGAAVIAVAASTTVYTADRWYIQTFANQASTISQISGVSGFNRYSCRIQRNAGQTGTNGFFFGFPFDTDEVVAMRGKIISLRFKARAGVNYSAASGALPFGFRVGTGAAAKRSAGVYTGETVLMNSAVNLTLGGAVIEHTFAGTIAVPSDATQGEFFFFITPVGTAGANDWVEVSDIVLEEGPAAGANLFPLFEEQLRACQRHFVKTFPYATAPAQNGGVNGAIEFSATGTGAVTQRYQHRLAVPQRIAAPTCTLFNPSAANAQIRNAAGAGADFTASAAASTNGELINISGTGNAGLAVNEQLQVHMTVDGGI